MDRRERSLIKAASESLSRNQYAKAKRKIERALKINENNPLSWIIKGISLFKLGKIDEGILCLDKCLELDPKNLDGYYNKAVLFEDLKRLEEAKKYYDQALRIDPLFPKAIINMSRVLSKQKDYLQAIIFCDKALEIGQYLAIAYNNKGVAFEGLGKYSEALENYDRGLAIDPQSVLLLKNKGYTLSLMGHPEEAKGYYQKCMDIDPNSIPRLWLENLYPWKVGDKLLIFDSFPFERINELKIENNDGSVRTFPLPLNSGGMGTIFYVRDLNSGRILAVKIPKEDEFIRKSILESRILLTMEPHPNIVECFLVNTLFGKPHIFTEFIEGGDLRTWINNEPKSIQDFTTLFEIVFQIASGMIHAHKHGLIHTDIKPENILMTKRDGKTILKIADFGLAKILKSTINDPENSRIYNESTMNDRLNESSKDHNDHSSMENASEPIFTKWYGSPEQWYSKPSDLNKTTDIFSFGVILYELFHGKRPFDTVVESIDANSAAYKNRNNTAVLRSIIENLYCNALKGTIQSFDGWNEDWKIVLRDIILTCLQINPLKRYNSFDELLVQIKLLFRMKEKKEYQIGNNSQVGIDDSFRLLLYSIRGKSLEKLGFNSAATHQYHKAIEISPINYYDHVNRGLCLDDLKLHSKAIESFDEALKIRPEDPQILNNKGVAYDKLKKPNEAIRCYDKVISKNPNYAVVWNNKGLALDSLEKYEEAVKSYDKALDCDPKYDSAMTNKAVSLFKLHEYDEAFKYFDLSLAIDPSNEHTLLQKAILYCNLKKYQDAIECAKVILKFYPNNTDAEFLITKSKARMIDPNA